MAVDFQKMFDDFVTGGNDSNAVREVYNIIPTFNQGQLEVISILKFYIDKYDLEDLESFLLMVINKQKSNKNLGYFDKQSAKALLKAYTVEEMVRGVKPQVQHVEEQQRGVS